MPPKSNVLPFHRQPPAEPPPDLKQELEDRLWREERHTYSTPSTPLRTGLRQAQGSRPARQRDPVDLTKETIKAWRRATLLTWVMMWGWWR